MYDRKETVLLDLYR